MVSGEGYECKKEVIILTTHKDFFGQHTYNINKTIVKFSREDCDHMVLTRSCDQILMQCQDNKCFSIQELNYDYVWLQTIKKVFFNCFYNTISIIGEEVDSALFNNIECIAKNLFCYAFDSIIIWKSNIIHNCPFEYVERLEFEHVDGFVLSKNKSLLFQIAKQVNFCETSMMFTTSGLYLTSAIDLKFLKRSEPQSIKQMIISNVDYKNFIIQASESVRMQRINEILCLNTLTLIKFSPKHYDKYFTQHGINISVILHSRCTQIFILKCVIISKIFVILTLNSCHENILIKFIYNNRTIGGYLSDQNIIRSQYINNNCSDTYIEYFTGNGRYKLTKTLYSVVVDHINVTDIVNSLTIFDYNSMSKLNYQHESMDLQNNDLTNNIYQSNNAIALKLKKLEKIQNTIHSEDQFGEQDHSLKYSILSLSITIIMFLL